VQNRVIYTSFTHAEYLSTFFGASFFANCFEAYTFYLVILTTTYVSCEPLTLNFLGFAILGENPIESQKALNGVNCEGRPLGVTGVILPRGVDVHYVQTKLRGGSGVKSLPGRRLSGRCLCCAGENMFVKASYAGMARRLSTVSLKVPVAGTRSHAVRRSPGPLASLKEHKIVLWFGLR